MTMHKALNPRYDTDIVYVSRIEERIELASSEDCVDAALQVPKACTKKSKEKYMYGFIKSQIVDFVHV